MRGLNIPPDNPLTDLLAVGNTPVTRESLKQGGVESQYSLETEFVSGAGAGCARETEIGIAARAGNGANISV